MRRTVFSSKIPCPTIPAEMKLKWLQKKHLMRRGLADLLPGPVFAPKKQGFVGPLARGPPRDLRGQAPRLLPPRGGARQGIFDGNTVRRILEDHFEGRETNDTLIWALMVFQVWFNAYLDSRPGSALDTPLAGSTAASLGSPAPGERRVTASAG